MAHKAAVTPSDIAAYQTARVAEHVSTGRFSDEEAVAKVVAEIEAYAESVDVFDPHDSRCACGWAGNNPYPDKASAVEALEYHYATVQVEEARAAEVAREKGEEV